VIFRQLFDVESSTYTYLFGDPKSGVAALVDTVREQVERDLQLVSELGLRLAYVLDTHVHADHVTGSGELRRRAGARVFAPRDEGPVCADEKLSEGDVVRIGDITVRVLSTPGHTVGCLSYVVEGAAGAGGRVEPVRVLTGDALLIRGCGRTDFQGGSSDVLWDSVTKKLFALADDVVVLPAHDYKGMTQSSIGEERRLNPRLGERMTREAFVALMANLNLPPPKRLSEAVPANRVCGDLQGGPREPHEAPPERAARGNG
jgi:glyoxylase-like metal-dependent hydrolase (beta-lactamase superfamily II)